MTERGSRQSRASGQRLSPALVPLVVLAAALVCLAITAVVEILLPMPVFWTFSQSIILLMAAGLLLLLTLAGVPLVFWVAPRERRPAIFSDVLVASKIVVGVFAMGVIVGISFCAIAPLNQALSSTGFCAPYVGPLPQIPVQSATATTLMWFKALQDGDQPLELALSTPAVRGSDSGCSFYVTEVRCHGDSGPPEDLTFTTVVCTFHVPSNPPNCCYDPGTDVGWEVDLERQPAGPWLIKDWGQG